MCDFRLALVLYTFNKIIAQRLLYGFVGQTGRFRATYIFQRYFVAVQAHVHFRSGRHRLVERWYRIQGDFRVPRHQMVDEHASFFKTDQTLVTSELRVLIFQHRFRGFLKATQILVMSKKTIIDIVSAVVIVFFLG